MITDFYDWEHIPKHIRICSPYAVVKGSVYQPSGPDKPKTERRLSDEQKRKISNEYNMYKARRENGKIIKIRLVESHITRKEVKKKYGISPNTLSAAERNNSVTNDGYYFVRMLRGRKPCEN